jgi:hypothetical protein
MFSRTSLHPTVNTAALVHFEYRQVLRVFVFLQDNTEAVLLLDPVTGEVSQSVNKVCLQSVTTKKVEALRDKRTGEENVQAVENNAVIKIEEESNNELQHNNSSENMGDIVVKKETEESISQDHALWQKNVNINVKCEVKDEIMIEEHEICLEDVQDVRYCKSVQPLFIAL